MTTLKLNDQGLPLPGRELDAYIAGILRWSDGPHTFYRWADRKKRQHPVLVFHYAPMGYYPDYSAFVDEAGKKFYLGNPKDVYIPTGWSTSAAFFQVMEAKKEEWLFAVEVYDTGVLATIHDDPRVCLAVANIDYAGRSVEETTAHAICAAVYLARKGEDDVNQNA